MRYIITLMFVWFSSLSVANASCNANACDDEYIDKLYAHGTYVLVELSGDKSTLTCALQQGRFIRLEQSHGNYEEIYALLLATQSADRRLGRLRMSDGAGTCTVSYAWQVRANIQN